MTALWLHYDCIMTALGLHYDCIRTALWLHYGNAHLDSGSHEAIYDINILPAPERKGTRHEHYRHHSHREGAARLAATEPLVLHLGEKCVIHYCF